MNTKLLRPMAASAALVAVLALSACGGDDKEKDAKDTTSQTPTADTETAETPETAEAEPTEEAAPTEAAPEAGSDDALDKFVESQQAGLKSVVDKTGGTFTDIKLANEDGVAVYTYVMSETLASAGASAMKGQEASYEAQAKPLLDMMKQQGIENPAIKFVFKSEGGEEIWSAEFK